MSNSQLIESVTSSAHLNMPLSMDKMEAMLSSCGALRRSSANEEMQVTTGTSEEIHSGLCEQRDRLQTAGACVIVANLQLTPSLMSSGTNSLKIVCSGGAKDPKAAQVSTSPSQICVFPIQTSSHEANSHSFGQLNVLQIPLQTHHPITLLWWQSVLPNPIDPSGVLDACI